MAPQRITPNDARRIIEDLQAANVRDQRLRHQPYTVEHRERIIEKLHRLANQAVPVPE